MVDDDAALLLPYCGYLHFTGRRRRSGRLTYRAWDASLGTPADKFDTTWDVCLDGRPLPPDGLCPDGSVPPQELEDAFSTARTS